MQFLGNCVIPQVRLQLAPSQLLGTVASQAQPLPPNVAPPNKLILSQFLGRFLGVVGVGNATVPLAATPCNHLGLSHKLKLMHCLKLRSCATQAFPEVDMQPAPALPLPSQAMTSIQSDEITVGPPALPRMPKLVVPVLVRNHDCPANMASQQQF
jgi:hypothetical protein